MSKKRGRSKQQPEQVQAIPEEVLAEGSGPLEGEAASIEVMAGVMAAVADDLAPAENAADVEIGAEHEATAIDDDGLSAQGDADPDAHLDGDGEADLEGEAELEGEAAAMPTSAASMDAVQLKQLIEALVFASDKPITVQRLRQLTRVSDVARLEQTLSEIAVDYAERGLVLQQVSGGYQFRTRPQFSAWVQQLIAGRPVRLSRAQLETLAIIAYRQPITRPEIDDIRGVDSSATLKLLMDRALIRVLGKKEEVGRPLLYGTTREFLDFFSLGDLRELPTLREYSELSDESRKVMSNRLGIGMDGGEGEGGEGGGGDSGGNDDDGGSSGSGGASGSGEPFDGGGEPGGDGGSSDEISAISLSDAASQVLGHEDVTNELAMIQPMIVDAEPMLADSLDETLSVDAETREVTPIVVETVDDDSETRELDPVTETMTLADAPDLDGSETRIVDPLIAAEALGHAETIVSSGESPE